MANGQLPDNQDGCGRSRSRSGCRWFRRRPEVNTRGVYGIFCAHRIPVFLSNVGLLAVHRFQLGYIAYVIFVTSDIRLSDTSSIANWQTVDLTTMTFPTEMVVDYVRVYQRKDSQNIGCDPPDYPTMDYISRHPEAYTSSFCPRRGTILHFD